MCRQFFRATFVTLLWPFSVQFWYIFGLFFAHIWSILAMFMIQVWSYLKAILDPFLVDFPVNFQSIFSLISVHFPFKLHFWILDFVILCTHFSWPLVLHFSLQGITYSSHVLAIFDGQKSGLCTFVHFSRTVNNVVFMTASPKNALLVIYYAKIAIIFRLHPSLATDERKMTSKSLLYGPF